MKKLTTLETEELACYITGLDYDQIDADEELISEALKLEFGCNLQQFTTLIQKLLPLIAVGLSPITQKNYKGFADDKKKMWFVKMQIEE